MKVISFKNELEFYSIDLNKSYQIIVLWIVIISFFKVYRDDDSSLKKYQLQEIYDA